MATYFTIRPPFGTDHFGNPKGTKYVEGTVAVLAYNLRADDLPNLRYDVQEPGSLAHTLARVVLQFEI